MDDNGFLYPYKGELTSTTAYEIAKQFQACFPKIPKNFNEVLKDAMIQNNFTDQRLRDSFYKIRDNYKYPELTIAEIINAGKRFKVLTPMEFEQHIKKEDANWARRYYSAFNHKGKCLITENQNIEDYDLPAWNKKTPARTANVRYPQRNKEAYSDSVKVDQYEYWNKLCDEKGTPEMKIFKPKGESNAGHK